MKRLLGLVTASALTLFTQTAGAATVVGNALVVTGANGPFAGQTASGGVFWDGEIDLGTYAVLSRDGSRPDVTHVDPTVGLYFDVGPYIFDEGDAFASPVFTFLDGILTSISYIVTDSSTDADLAAYNVNLFTFDIFRRPDGSPAVSFDGNTYGVNAIIKYLAPVPLPAGLPLLAGALGLLAFMRRRKTA